MRDGGGWRGVVPDCLGRWRGGCGPSGCAPCYMCGGYGGAGGGGGGGYGASAPPPGIIMAGPLWANEAQQEGQYATQVALNRLINEGNKVGLDKNGNLYVWWPGSQVCINQTDCSAATQASWVELGDLPWEVRNKILLGLAGNEAQTAASWQLYAIWGAAYATRFAITGAADARVAVYVFVGTHPTAWWWVMNVGGGALGYGAPINIGNALGRIGAWIWKQSH